MNIFSISTSRAAPDHRLRNEAQDWLLLLTSGRATAADARALQQWCAQSPQHAAAFEQAKRLWHGLKPAAEACQATGPRHFGRRAFLGGALAASVALLAVRVSVPGGFAGLGADYQTAVGEQRRVDLDDGLSLELNTQTRLSRRELAAGGQGLELLEGEVEVSSRGALPVRVQAGNGWLSASRARFNVRNTDHSVCVTCIDGALQVEVGGRLIRLDSGRQLTYDSQRVGEPKAVDPTTVIAWREQVLVFDNATLNTVIDEINRYRPGMLVLLNAELGKRKVQARFNLNQLAGVALLIRDAYGAKCTELPGGVVLLS
ncbi:FecR domain-containing protein [Pseudomonas sp. MRSN 12121]|uniref:FecR family protein n=1 Tax=Pseudomonas sp. MRSN 12121 TaxID=1611770 RepID=UPI0005BEBE95|nr:FecR domain-containing protein [Pseudomonas sp. MRSN 12121]AJO78361.1 iron dicitrate transport regulator FecR [Pseudomonas sp. MRSN 12121]